MKFPITSDLRLTKTYMGISNELGNPAYFYEQGLVSGDPTMTGKQIVDLKFNSYILNKYMGGQSFDIFVRTQSPVPIDNYFYLEAKDGSSVPFSICEASACQLYMKDTPDELIDCELSGGSSGISIKTSE